MEVENLRISLLGVNKEAVIHVSLRRSVSASVHLSEQLFGECAFFYLIEKIS